MHRNIKNQNPFLLKQIKVVLCITALVCCLSYFFIDIPLAQYFEHISPILKKGSKILTNLIDPKYQYFLWPILYFIFRLLWRKKQLAIRCLILAISIPLTNLIVEIIKTVLGRARPDILFSEHIYGLTFFSTSSGYHSFPSGHACTIGAICGAFGCFYPKAAPSLVVLAFLLAFTRVILTYHFFSDIIAGTVIGILISEWIYTKNKILTTRGM